MAHIAPSRARKHLSRRTRAGALAVALFASGCGADGGLLDPEPGASDSEPTEATPDSSLDDAMLESVTSAADNGTDVSVSADAGIDARPDGATDSPSGTDAMIDAETSADRSQVTDAREASADISVPSADAKTSTDGEASTVDAVHDSFPDVSRVDDGSPDAVADDGAGDGFSSCPAPTSEECLAEAGGPDGAAVSPPSFARDITPIFAARCKSCHALGNDGGRWPLEKYEHIYDWRLLIRYDLVLCKMPPSNSEVALTPDERAVIIDWLNCGAPDN
jgi:hypothetical protein